MRHRTACVTWAAILAAALTVSAQQPPARETPDGLEFLRGRDSSDCILSQSALLKLRAFALTGMRVHPIPGDVVTAFGLRTTAVEVPAKQVYIPETSGAGRYFISFALDSDDIFFIVRAPGKNSVYLTDTTMLLRLAGWRQDGGSQIVASARELLPGQPAETEYLAALRRWGGVVRGNAAFADPRLGC
jgi:hypothetical protein